MSKFRKIERNGDKIELWEFDRSGWKNVTAEKNERLIKILEDSFDNFFDNEEEDDE